MGRSCASVVCLPMYVAMLTCAKATGSAQCVGTMGAALGAGIGPLQGHRGLMLDSLESAQMVIANGSMVTTSRTQNPDLFWAIRGAGFNFGIVTEATFKVFNATFGGHVMEGDMLFPGSANGSFWEVFKSFDDDAKLDPKLSLVAALSYSHETNEVRMTIGLCIPRTDKFAVSYRPEHQLLRPERDAAGVPEAVSRSEADHHKLHTSTVEQALCFSFLRRRCHFLPIQSAPRGRWRRSSTDRRRRLHQVHK